MAGRVTGHVRLVSRAGGDRWYVKYRRADGRQVQKCLGPAWAERSRPPAGYFTRKLADEALQAILVREREAPTLAPESGAATFRQAVDGWLRYVEHEKGRTPATVAGYRSAATARLIPAFGADTPLVSITTEQIDGYRERLLTEGNVSPRTAQKLLVELHAILKWAKRRKWIATNPAEDAERVTVRRSGDFNVLSSAEVLAVERAAGSALFGAVFVVAAFTGLRMGELRALRWCDVDFESRNVFVRFNRVGSGAQKRPKSHRIRSVPLIDQAAKALDDLSRREHYTGADDLVFTERGGPLDEGAMRDGFYAALKQAGLGRMRAKDEPITFHDLRHTFGTLGAQAWSLHDLQAYMGHADIQTTMIYVHHVPKVEAADALSKLVEAETGAEIAPISTLGRAA